MTLLSYDVKDQVHSKSNSIQLRTDLANIEVIRISYKVRRIYKYIDLDFCLTDFDLICNKHGHWSLTL